jgi:hypothetical protein
MYNAKLKQLLDCIQNRDSYTPVTVPRGYLLNTPMLKQLAMHIARQGHEWQLQCLIHYSPLKQWQVAAALQIMSKRSQKQSDKHWLFLS